MLPLVTRTGRALSRWLGPAWEEGLSLRPDLDQVSALSPEREALWARVDKATFLSRAEKREAVGYGAASESAGDDAGDDADAEPEPVISFAPPDSPAGSRPEGASKFNPYHDPENGQFTTADGGGGDGSVDLGEIVLARLEGELQYLVDLEEEELRGGHTNRDHVAKSDEYLLQEVTKVRARFLIYVVGYKQEGSFHTREDANNFVNRVLEEERAMVDRVSSGELREAALNKRFGFETGKEGYKPSGSEAANIRPTYSVRVIIKHDRRSPRGYTVRSAFPRNQIAGE